MSKTLKKIKEKDDPAIVKTISLTAKMVIAATTLIIAVQGFVSTTPISNFITMLKYHNPWFWMSLAIILLVTCTSTIIQVFFWKMKLNMEYLEDLKKHKFKLTLKIGVTLILQVAFVLLIVYLSPNPDFKYHESDKIFSQSDIMGSLGIGSYASNGEVHYELIDKQGSFGPKAYLSVVLKMHRDSAADNCGLIFTLLKGTDLKKYQYVRFQLKGSQDDDKLGIKAKDAMGVEVALPIEGQYIHGGKITTTWEDVSIPFSHFGNVDFGLMDNFSIYISGDTAGTRPHAFEIGGISFIQ